MLDELNRKGYLDQETAVQEIARRFGEQFTYINENGNASIQKNVLTAFRKVSESSVVWDREDREWRKRKPNDSPGRQQDY
jgi:hypothetical protein